MLLENKNAIVYGWGGSVGGAVSRAFAREGARVFLAGRTLSRVEAVAEEISAAGGVTTLADVGNTAAFLASDRAGATTGTVANLTSGTVVD